MRFALASLVAVAVVVSSPAVVEAKGTTYVFTGADGSLWGDPKNWSPPGVPGKGDTASVGMTVTRAKGKGLKALILDAGMITDGTISVEAAFTWTGGQLGGEAPLTVTLGKDCESVIAPAPSAVALDGARIINEGSLSVSGELQGCGDGLLDNRGSTTLATGTSLAYCSGVNAVMLDNTGTVTVSGSGSVSNTQAWGLRNSGAIAFSGGGTWEWTSSPDATLTLEGGTSISGDGVLLFDGVAQLTLDGTTTIASGATLEFGAGAIVQAAVGKTGGTLDGPGTLLWTGGQISGTGRGRVGRKMTWGPSLVAHLTGGSPKDLSASYVVSQATVLWDAGELGVGSDSYFENSGRFTAAGDLMAANGPASSGGGGTIDNVGTFTKSAGSGALTFEEVRLLNTGTFDVASGKAVLAVGSAVGPSVLEAGSILSGTVVFTSPVSLSGQSTVAAGGTLELTVDGSGDRAILQGKGSLGGAGTVRIDGAEVLANEGPLELAAGGHVVIAPNATSTDLTIAAPGSLTFAGATTWTGGTVEIDSGRVLNTGTWTTTAGAYVTENVSSASLDNSGTFDVNPGSGASVQIDTQLVNTGLVVLQSGSLWTDKLPYVQQAGETQLAGGSLVAHDTQSPPNPLDVDVRGGTVTGSGTIDGVVTNDGTFAPGTSSAAGELTVTQSYTQSTAGTLDVALGGVQKGEFDVLATGGDVKLAGTLDVLLLGGYLPVRGDTYAVVQSMGADPDRGKFATVNDPSGVTLTTTYDKSDVVLGVKTVTMPDGGAPDAGREGGMEDGGRHDGGDDAGEVADAAPGDDAAAGHDAGATPDASATDASTPTGELGDGAMADGAIEAGAGQGGGGSGCGCALVGEGGAPAPAGWLASLGLVIGLGARRRRRAGAVEGSSAGRSG